MRSVRVGLHLPRSTDSRSPWSNEAKTSLPPGPFSIWVDESREYEARNAIAIAGAMSADPRGISTSITGASSVFLGAMERVQ